MTHQLEVVRRPGEQPPPTEPQPLRPVRLPTAIPPLEEAEAQYRAAQEAVAVFKTTMASLVVELADVQRQRSDDWDNADLIARLSDLERAHKDAPGKLAYLLSNERDARVALYLATERPALVLAIEDADARDHEAQIEEHKAREHLAVCVRVAQSTKAALGNAHMSLRLSDGWLTDPRRGGLTADQLDEVRKLDSKRSSK